ncbi:MAG: helix-hairpin-helix domain-containing protein [Patescibacteria group bacterium]|jgi:competence protein ComEA
MQLDYGKVLDKIALPLGIILTISLLLGAYFIIKYSNSSTKTTNASEQVTIDIAGAVQTPGVYNFTTGQIIEDAIKQAGGLTDQADLELMARTVNRAAELQNHGKIYIPVKGEVNYSVAGSTSSSTTAVAGPVNINTANSAELDTLPGIGPVTAGYIIDYRTKKGPFKKKEDLMKVSGISATKYAKLKDLITI